MIAPRVPYKSYSDDSAADKIARLLAAIPMWLVILTAIIIGGGWGWAIAS